MSGLKETLQRTRPAFILWKHVIREIIPPTALGFMVFTFLLLMRFLLQISRLWIEYGAELDTVLWAIVYSLPHIVVLTLPMGVLVGGLIAFGRMSADFEIVALRSLGLSLTHLLPPVLIFATLMWAVNSWLFMTAMPWGNTKLRELQWETITQRAFSNEVKPRVFHDHFPGLVLYVEDIVDQGREWHGVFAAQEDTDPPTIVRAETAYPVVDELEHKTYLQLERGTIVVASADDPREVTIEQFQRKNLLVWSEERDSIVGGVSKDGRSMTLAELREAIATRQEGGDPAFDLRVEVQKKYAFPVGCLIFGLLSLPLGISTQRQTTAIGFATGTVVILVYYFFAQNGEQQGDVGNVAPWLGIWSGNIVLGSAGVLLLWKKARERDFGLARRLVPIWERVADATVEWVRSRVLGSASKAQGTRHRGDFPRTLDRYVLHNYASIYALAFVALVAVWTVVEWLDKSSYVQNPEFIAEFFKYRIFEIVFDVIPIAAVITVLATFSLMAKRNEVTAALAGGVSLYRLMVPVLLPAVGLSVTQYLMQDYVIPLTKHQADAVEQQMHPSGATQTLQHEQTWVFSEGQRVFHFDDYLPNLAEFRGLRIYYLTDGEGGISRMEYADRAAWNREQSRWEGTDGWRRYFVAGDDDTDLRPTELEEFRFTNLPIDEPPSYFDQSPRTPDEMSTLELRRHVRVLRERGYETFRALVDFHMKLSWPAVTFVMTLVGIPFAFRMGRHGALTGVAVAIGLVVCYWIAFGVFRALGYAGTLPAPLAAWAPHLLFLSLAAHQALGLRT